MLRTRRPLYYIAVSFASSVLIRQYFGVPVSVLICGLLAGLWLQRRHDSPKDGSPGEFSQNILLLLIAVSFAAGFLHTGLYEQRLAGDPVLNYLGRSVSMTGTVTDPEYYTDSKGRSMLRINVKLLVIEGSASGSSRVLLTIPEEAVSDADALTHIPPGTVISWTGEPQLAAQRRNPGVFDYRQYLKSCGIQGTVRAEQIRVIREARGIRTGLFLLREHYLQRLREHAGGETAGMLRAILFGEKSQLDGDVQELFQKNGTAHILAVSGLHVGMLYAAMVWIWDMLSARCPALFGYRRGRRFFICTAVFFAGYTFLAGYSPSVVRAVCMVLLHTFAIMTGRRYDLSSAAFAVGIGALLRNPYVIFQAGFQMSFLAILTLGLITPYVHRVWSGALTGSIAIQIGLGPYTLYQFNILSLIAVFINVPVIFLAGILVPAGMAGMLVPVGTGLFDRGLASLCAIMLRLNEICCVDHLTSLTAASPPLWSITAFYLGLLVFASEEGRLMILRCRGRVIPAVAALVLLAALLFGNAAESGLRQTDLVFVDVGQGDCMHLRSGRGNYLIDGGGSEDYDVGRNTLRPYLLKNGASRVDAAFVTHLHTDHYKGICELAKEGMIRRLFIYEGNRVNLEQICAQTGLAKENILFLHAGETVRLSGEDTVEVLWPEARSEGEYRKMMADEDNENDHSLILRVNIRGVSMLVTGDLGEDGEQNLMESCGASEGQLHADILKVGHHGSKTSSSDAFLDAVSPKAAVIQVGEHNMYGHPTPETLERLARRRIPVYRNDLQGAVGIRLRAGEIRTVETTIPDLKE